MKEIINHATISDYFPIMDLECYICQENVRIPVRFLCFDCPRNNHQPTCNSMTRVCIQCAREYLQLNKPIAKRTAKRKCLLCPATISCQNITPQQAYEKDYLLMRLDTKPDYPCFHEDCRFTGTQMELDHHLQHDCLFRNVCCPHCKKHHPLHRTDDHKKRCSGFTTCVFCSERTPTSLMRDHVLETHQKTFCTDCKTFIQTETMQDHPKKCPFHRRQCPYCRNKLFASGYYSHVSKHLEDLQREKEWHVKAMMKKAETIELLSKERDDFATSFFDEDEEEHAQTTTGFDDTERLLQPLF